MKKLTSIILTFVITISILGASMVAPITANATTTINIGDYVQMGKYYDEPILWRCVDIDENGPLMLADRILTIKPFDAKGTHIYSDGTTQTDTSGYRTRYGSNLWETSNIRSWLNSTATAGNVTWLDGCPPTGANVYNGWNDYATEKGFMADGNFTASERNTIKTVTQKSILNAVDVPKLKVGGTVNHTYDSNISTVVQNYDTAYYHNITDKVFLLDVKQLNKVYQNSTTLGTNYYIGKPAQKAVDNSEYKDSGLNTSNNWYNWNRTPYSDSYSPGDARYVYSDGSAGNSPYYSAYDTNIGVRPAFYINLTSVIFKSGKGTVESPYSQNSTVTYNANGSISGVVPNSESYAEGTKVVVASNSGNLVKTGYTFGGWNTNADGSGTNYTAGTGMFVMGSTSITLYAKWTIAITFDSQGGTIISETTGEYNKNIIPPTAPTKTGYTFGGWYKESACINAWDFSTDVVISNTTLYAKWVLTTYKTTLIGATSSLPNQNVSEKIYFAVSENTKNYVVTLRYNSNNLKYNSVTARDFAYITPQTPINDSQNLGYKLVTIICQYSTSGFKAGNILINPFDINFEILSTATIGNTTIDIVNNTDDNKNNLYTISDTNTKVYFTNTQNITLEVLPQSATEISITGNDNIISPTQYEIIFTPTYTTYKNIQWSLDDESIATIDQNGLLTPKKNGSIIITALTLDGSNKTATKAVTISEQKASLDNIQTNTGIWDMPFQKAVFNYTINVPFRTTNIDIIPTYNDGLLICNEYSMCFNGFPLNINLSSNSTVVVLTYSGVTGYNNGVYNITITKTGETVTLDKEYLSLTIGETAILTATSNQNLTWETSDNNIVTVDQNGSIRAIADGTATISVINVDGDIAECIVNVTPKIYPYTISNLSVNSDEINIDILKNENRLTKDNIIVVSYNERNQMVQIDVTDIYFAVGVKTNITNLLINTQYSKLKIFIWDNLSGLRPLSNIAEFNLNNRAMQLFSLSANFVE